MTYRHAVGDGGTHSGSTIGRLDGPIVAFGVAVLVAVAVLLGWWTDTPVLVDWGGTGTSTPWSAVWIMVAGAAAVVPGRVRRVLSGAAALAALVGLTLPDVARGVQRLAFADPEYVSSPGTMVTVLLLGAAGWALERRWWPVLLAVGAVAVAHLTVVANLLGIDWLATAGAASPLAGLSLPTAAAAVASATAIALRAEQLGHLRTPLMRHSALRRARAISFALFAAGAGGAFVAEVLADGQGGGTAYVAVASLAVLVAMGGTVVALDIERREAAEALEVMIDASPDAAVFVSDDGTIVRANAQAEVLFGWAPPDLVGRPIEVLIPTDRREAHRQHLRIYRRNPTPRRMEGREVVGLHRDGTVLPVEIALSPIRLDQGMLYAATIRDARIHRRQLDQLAELQAMQDLLLTAVSHEVRTPLTIVQGLARTLQENRGRLDPQVQEQLVDGISRNTDRLAELLADLMDVEAIRRRERHAEPVRTDLSGIVLDVVRMWRGPSDRMVVAHVQPDLWAMTVPGTVDRIVENLLSNADAYAPTGPVEVHLREDGEHVLLLVEDHGPGVPHDLRLTVFRPFQRGPRVRRDSPGTGLGLTVVQMLARMADGTAWVEGRENGQPGASFRVRLPRARAPMPSAVPTGVG